MTIPPLASGSGSAAQLQAFDQQISQASAGGAASKPSAAAAKKAASQFEAIILRQLLAPSIEPIMNGGMGGSGGSGMGGGGGVYGYMLTDVLANSLSSAGGLGLGRMLETQLAPTSAKALSESKTDSKPDPKPLS